MERKNVIDLFLLQGEYSKSLKCQDSTSVLVGYKILREDLKNQDLLDLIFEKENAGAYIMIGTNDEGEDIAYIGKANNLYKRIKQPHFTIDDNWAVVLLITTINNSLDAVGISYLESAFYNMAIKEERYKIVNAQDIDNGNPRIEVEVSLNKFIDLSKIYISIMGYRIFEPKIAEKNKVDKFVMSDINNSYKGEGYWVAENNHFILLKGSKINDRDITAGTASFVTNLREKYSLDMKDFITTKDIEFTSPSLAAAFVYGQNASGLARWKLSNGTTLKEYINNLTF